MTPEELRALPVSVDVVTAGKALGIGRANSYALAKTGEFPVPVLKIGQRYRVVTAELYRLLGIEPLQTNGAAPRQGNGTEVESTPTRDLINQDQL